MWISYYLINVLWVFFVIILSDKVNRLRKPTKLQIKLCEQFATKIRQMRWSEFFFSLVLSGAWEIFSLHVICIYYSCDWWMWTKKKVNTEMKRKKTGKKIVLNKKRLLCVTLQIRRWNFILSMLFFSSGKF